VKRWPKGILTPKLQKHICESLEKCNTIKTAMQSAGASERVFYDWMKNPSFAAAVYRARSRAKAKLGRVITNAAPKDWRAAAFVLERSWPNEYARTERIQQIGEKADDKKLNLQIYYNNDQPLSSLLDFPVHPSMAMGYDAWKAAEEKRRLAEESGATENAPAEAKISDEEKIAEDYPAPKIVNPALTGRVKSEWRGNGK